MKFSAHKQKGFSSVIVLLTVLIVIGGGVFYFINSRTENDSASSDITAQKDETPAPSISHEKEVDIKTVPFYEMTIPALRNRSYESNLELGDVYSDTSTYKASLVSYTSDDLKINGILTVPKGIKPAEGWPAVVFVHGYIPPTVYKTTVNYASYVDYLAKSGIVVFKIDLRGHDTSEGVPHGAYYSEGYVVDTLNAYAALRNTEFVDPTKIGLWGHSMAGNVTFRSFVIGENIPKLVVWAGAGYTYEDLAKYAIKDTSYRSPEKTSERQKRREELFKVHGSFDPEDEFWKQVVPTNYLDDVSGNIQIHHAVDDAVVSVGYSRDLVSILDPYEKISSELFEYQSGGHNISGSSFTQAMQRTVDFLKEY